GCPVEGLGAEPLCCIGAFGCGREHLVAHLCCGLAPALGVLRFVAGLDPESTAEVEDAGRDLVARLDRGWGVERVEQHFPVRLSAGLVQPGEESCGAAAAG